MTRQDDEPRGPRLIGPIALREGLAELWEHGMPPGDKTGWPSLDQHYTVAPGQLSIVTGWPSSGKSEWLDALLINLARQGWHFAMFSPENQPVRLHVAKMLEKWSGKPFSAGRTERMLRDEVFEYVDELGRHFCFMEVENGAISPESVLSAANEYLGAVGGKRGLVIDPWNELEHWRPPGLSETEYISKTLSMIRNWARVSGVHVWIVAHPQKLRRDDGGKLPVPTPDAIAGSAHFWNKADCAITVWRDLANLDSQEVKIYVQKVRFKHIGRSGVIELRWDRVTGRYFEPKNPPAVVRRYGDHRE
jgi:twinkle protein